jgi:hypothetical protein
MEDQPALTAKTLSDFADRYRFGESIVVKGMVAHLPGAAAAGARQ